MHDPSRHVQSYSDIAGEYNQKRFSGSSGRFLFETDRSIIQFLHSLTRARVTIDVPVGTGRVLQYLPSTELIGADYTPEMLQFARGVANPNLHTLMRADASQLPLPDAHVDCLISLRFFHLFPPEDRKAFASEFLRIVRPGGYLIVSFTNGWYGGALGWIKRLLGLKTVYFQYPGELKRLFPRCKVQKCVGNYLPGQHLFSRIGWIRLLLYKATSVPPLNLICGERFYLLQKASP